MILQIMWVSWLMMLLSLWPVASSDAKPGCQEKCGNVSVPYPFGILEKSCAMNDDFFLNCTSNDEGHPELLFGTGMPISDISELEGTVTVGIYAAFNCYNKTGIETDSYALSMTLRSGPFMFSNTRNIFTDYWLRYLSRGDPLPSPLTELPVSPYARNMWKCRMKILAQVLDAARPQSPRASNHLTIQYHLLITTTGTFRTSTSADSLF
ncbi:hypothetical protein OIU79_021829 [Salix purpurea]|uniref:Wall-associated receptor kinase galacturonan-binding domain-containing protein n=1 Tax=Salix purpurea TaxID=77065 RepID=A0A9Q0WEC5_SALPP|nr:hypothetical protein OIU79_021829 [Salix purpurea]